MSIKDLEFLYDRAAECVHVTKRTLTSELGGLRNCLVYEYVIST